MQHIASAGFISIEGNLGLGAAQVFTGQNFAPLARQLAVGFTARELVGGVILFER